MTDEFQDAVGNLQKCIRTSYRRGIAHALLGCGAAFSQVGDGRACSLATRHYLATWHGT